MGHNEYIHLRYSTLGTFVALFCSNTLRNKSTHCTWLKCLYSSSFSKCLTGTDPGFVHVYMIFFHYELMLFIFPVEIIMLKKTLQESIFFNNCAICVDRFHLIVESCNIFIVHIPDRETKQAT